jgi:succinoglycan biosynthesis transport protein ExoP
MTDAQEFDPTPRRILDVFRRRAPLVLVCFLVAVGASLAYTLHAQKRYTATVSLLFNDTPLSQQVAGLQAVPNTNVQSQQDTNTQLLKLPDVAQQTAARVGHGLTGGTVAGSVSVSPQSDTTVVNVSSTLASPALAAQVANTYASVFINAQDNGDRQYYESALATVEGQIAKLSPTQATGAQGLALQQRAQSLSTLAQLRNDTVKLVQAATVPSSPSSPSKTRNVFLAALLGLVLGVVLAFGVERLDQSLREPEELESIYGLPLLGAVPDSSALRRGGRGLRAGGLPAGVGDTFQFIRARLRYFNVDRDLRTLAIISAQPGDGKTTIAHWLADAAAAMGSRTLLIEADLRRPTLADEARVRPGPGLTDVLMGARVLEDVIQKAELTTASEEPESERYLDVVVAGALPPNPAEMLESHAMSEVLKQAKAKYDFVVIDTPPLGAVSDSLPLLRIVDGVAIVAGVGTNRRDVAKRLAATLRSVDAPLIGVIANRVKSRAMDGYGYEYGADPEKVAQNMATAQTNGGTPSETNTQGKPDDRATVTVDRDSDAVR